MRASEICPCSDLVRTCRFGRSFVGRIPLAKNALALGTLCGTEMKLTQSFLGSSHCNGGSRVPRPLTLVKTFPPPASNFVSQVQSSKSPQEGHSPLTHPGSARALSEWSCNPTTATRFTPEACDIYVLNVGRSLMLLFPWHFLFDRTKNDAYLCEMNIQATLTVTCCNICDGILHSVRSPLALRIQGRTWDSSIGRNPGADAYRRVGRNLLNLNKFTQQKKTQGTGFFVRGLMLSRLPHISPSQGPKHGVMWHTVHLRARWWNLVSWLCCSAGSTER